jgi:hypothetical protein
MTLRSYSGIAAAATVVATASQALNLSLEFPLPHIQLAWTLTRVLLQL